MPRNFRLLVNWLSEFQIGIWSEVPENYKKLFVRNMVPPPIRFPLTSRNVFPKFDSTTGKQKAYSDEEISMRLNVVTEVMKSKGFSDVDITTVTDRLRIEMKPRFTEVSEEGLERLRLRSREKRARFFNSLLQAWCIRQADHKRAWDRKEFRKAHKEIARPIPIHKLLDLTYVPVTILEMVPSIRESLEESRKELSESLMSYRQKQARGIEAQIIGHDGKRDDIAPSEKWEARWCSNLGIDKRSADPTRQYIWTLVFTPLVTALLPHTQGRKRERWKDDSDGVAFLPDEVFKRASTLLHTRYPEYWSGNWQLVKNRYTYKRMR